MIGDFSQYQPLEEIRGKLVFNKRGEYSVGMRLGLPEVFSCTVDDLKEINELILKIIRLLPPYSCIHKQDWCMEMAYEPDRRNMKDILGQFYEFSFKGRPYVHHECYLYIIRSTRSLLYRSSQSVLLNNPAIVPDIIDELAIQKFLSTIENIKGIINSSGLLHAEYLTEDDYYPDDTKGKTGLLNQCATLSKSKVLYDYDCSKGLRVGNNYVEALTIDNLNCYPAELALKSRDTKFNTDMSFAYPVGIGLKCNHIYNQYIYIVEKDEYIRNKAEDRKTMMLFGSVSIGNKTNAAALDGFLKEASKESTIVKFHGNLILWGDNREKVNLAKVEANSAFAKMGFIASEENVEKELLYWASFPGNGCDLPAHKSATLFAHQATTLLNYETNYTDSPSDVGMKLFDRVNNIPVHVDFVEYPKSIGLIDSRNKVLVAPTGKGKSVLANFYLHDNYLAGNDMIIIDKGKSYFLQCMYFKEKYGDAAYFEYSNENKIGFNPFYYDGVLNGEPPDEDKIGFLREMIFALWFDESISPDKNQDSVIDNVIIGYYTYIHSRRSKGEKIFPKFDTFYHYMKDSYDQVKKINGVELKYIDYDSFLLVMAKYLSSNRYGMLLNSEENIDLLNKRFVVFEIDKIGENKDLLALYTIMIMDTYIQKLYKLKHKPGIREQVQEEAWSSLMNNKMARFMHWSERTVRKHDGAMFVITQQLEDLLNNEIVKNTIIANSPIKIIGDLSDYKDAMNQVADLLGLSVHERDQIAGMNKEVVRGIVYKEFLIKVGPVSRIYRVVLSRLHLILFESNQKYVEAVSKLAAKHGSFAKVIDAMIVGDIDVKIETGGRIMVMDKLSKINIPVVKNIIP